MSHLPYSARSAEILFEPQDFGPNYERSTNAASNLTELFRDVIGCEKIVQRLEGYQHCTRAKAARSRSHRVETVMRRGKRGASGTPLIFFIFLPNNVHRQQRREQCGGAQAYTVRFLVFINYSLQIVTLPLTQRGRASHFCIFNYNFNQY